MLLDKKQIARLNLLVELLHREQYPGKERLIAAIIQRKHAYSDAEFKQDIGLLRSEFKAPIKYDFKKKGYFLIDRNWFFSYTEMIKKGTTKRSSFKVESATKVSSVSRVSKTVGRKQKRISPVIDDVVSPSQDSFLLFRQDERIKSLQAVDDDVCPPVKLRTPRDVAPLPSAARISIGTPPTIPLQKSPSPPQTSSKHPKKHSIVVSVIVLLAIAVFLVLWGISTVERMSLEYGLRAYKEERYQDAVSHFRRAASLGSTEAEYMLGECYYNGYGVDRNLRYAYRWYRKADTKNHEGARRRIVYDLIDPEFLIMKKEDAIDLCSQEADKGSRDAQYKLALLYSDRGVMAYRCFERAAEQGHPDAQYRLADCYENAKGMRKKDYAQAYYWYQKAAENGIKDAEKAMERVKKAEAKEIEEAKKQKEALAARRESSSSQPSLMDLSYYDPMDPLSWREEEARDEARLGYDKAPYKCRRCGMRSFFPLDDGVNGVSGFCIDCLNYLFF